MQLCNKIYYSDEPTISGWLKVGRYAEVPKQDRDLSIYRYLLALG
jgi:hypothetical protein